ncbi:MAG: sigma 54-interacting transcriptional regulator [Gracilibacteraceae bacterium]|nr:sigma 54-interacting transcriptional regulator [Gracilibacteraceae bacterium]
MKSHIDINSICIAASIYSSSNQKLASNKYFDELFGTETELEAFEHFISINVPNPANIGTGYFTYSINNKEYLVSIIEIAKEQNYLITLQDTSLLNNAVKKMRVVRDMENEFYEILGAIHDDFVIIDNKGVIIKVLDNFDKMYGIPGEEAIGKTIFEMEERKIFNPSVAIRVFRSGKAETMLQLTGANKYLMCTAIPIKGPDNEIIKIISYTRDVTKYETLKSEYNKLSETLEKYSAELEHFRSSRNAHPSIIGSSNAIKNIIETVDKVSKFDANILFTGESGVGKTMFAKLTHSQSSRKDGPFIEINCGAIPDNLLESELFGYEKGAFTGANKEGKIGLIELANNGTLFLDEIGDLPLHMQVKLLKVIQEKKLIRVGGTEEITVDFRLISATSKKLNDMVDNGEFREELFYRINVITIHIPSLRERKEDIFSLCMHFLEKCKNRYGLDRTLSNTAIDYLTEYNWPGNIRELENTIERLVLTSDNYMITEDYLPSNIKSQVISTTHIQNKSLKSILAEVEKKIILDAYKKHGTTTGVAKELGISQPSASLKINQYIKKTDE